MNKVSAMRLLSLAVPTILLAGCVRFQHQPLSPVDTAAELEGRNLTNSAIKDFLATNLSRPPTDWPLASWDSQLLTLVAFYYHPSLEVARADWRASLAGEKAAAERPNPTVTASTQYEPASGAFSPWIPGLIFDLPLETSGKRRLRGEHARHLSEAARFDLAVTAWQVRSQLLCSLLEWVAADERAHLLQQGLVLRKDLADRLEQQLQAGAAAPLELNTARLALVRSRAESSDAERLLAEARPRLASALGLPVAALQGMQVRLDLAAIPDAEELTNSRTRELALRGRADILGALASYAASQSALQLEIAKQYPDVHLGPGYSWNAGSTGEHDWQLGLTVELPLLNRHRGPIAEAAARRDASAARFRAVQAKVIGEVDAAVASFRADQLNVAAMNTLLESQAAHQHLVEQQFQAGAADRLDVLAAELEFNAAQLAQVDARVRLQQAFRALENAVQRPIEVPNAILQSRPPPGSE